MLALPKEVLLELGEEAQGIAVVAARSGLGASTYYTMRTGKLTPWTIQVNCTSPSNLDKLLAEELELRWKKKNQQKTEKNQPKSGL